jgi:hypothetical protein
MAAPENFQIVSVTVLYRIPYGDQATAGYAREAKGMWSALAIFQYPQCPKCNNCALIFRATDRSISSIILGWF